jgi:hypothetical protein
MYFCHGRRCVFEADSSRHKERVSIPSRSLSLNLFWIPVRKLLSEVSFSFWKSGCAGLNERKIVELTVIIISYQPRK